MGVAVAGLPTKAAPMNTIPFTNSGFSNATFIAIAPP